jgi:hypothetical protein
VPFNSADHDQRYRVEEGLIVKEALLTLGLDSDLHLAVRGVNWVTEGQYLVLDDKLKPVAIVSGGNL